MVKNGKIAILTALGDSYGSGHYKKSLILQSQFSAENKPILYVISKYGYKKEKDEYHVLGLSAFINLLLKEDRIVEYLIIDKRETSLKWIKTLKCNGVKLLLIDSVGEDRKYSSYCINPIPSFNPDSKSNLWDMGFLPPIRYVEKKKKKKNLFHVVLFFGYKDDQRLTYKVLKKIKQQLKYLQIGKEKVTYSVFLGGGNKLNYYVRIKSYLEEHFELLTFNIYWNSDDFYCVLKESDLLLTYYGMSAFESCYMGVPVLLYNPSDYHQKLSKHFFPKQTTNKGEFKLNCYEDIYQNMLGIQKRLLIDEKLGEKFSYIPKLLKNLSKDMAHFQCPNCKSNLVEVFHRNKVENFYHCLICSLIYKKEILIEKSYIDKEYRTIEYGENYFLDEYQKSYNKVYEEDRNNIYEFSKKRLEQIQKVKREGNLLDIGCAMGFFLDKAQERGYKTKGVEISSYAHKVASQSHDVFQGNIFDYPVEEKIDIVTLWYVIEHFEDHKAIFDKIASLQTKKGILAMSTPNGNGITAKFSRDQFYKTSPQDHHYIYTENSLINILKPYGYKHFKTVSTGIHYSRFQKRYPNLSKWVSPKVYSRVAQKYNLGDTFEIYFIKKN